MRQVQNGLTISFMLSASKVSSLENTRLLEAERARARRQAALLRLSEEIAGTFDETEVGHRVVEGLHDEALGYELVGLYLLDERNNGRVLVAGVGLAQNGAGERIPAGRGLSEQAMCRELETFGAAGVLDERVTAKLAEAEAEYDEVKVLLEAVRDGR